MISVIIAAYNMEKYLVECLESLLHQTIQDLEILIIDDGSADGTWNIIRDYEQRDQRIKAFQQSNQGPAAARNVALKAMTGDYFTVIDADDWIESDCYEKAYAAAKKTDSDMVIWGFQRFSGEKVIPQPDPMLKNGLYTDNECRTLWKDFIYREKRRVNPFIHCRLIRSSLVKDNGLSLNPKLKRSEDYMFLSQVHYYCRRVYSMADQMYLHYRQNEESITHKYVPGYFEMVLEIYSQLKAFAEENHALDKEIEGRLDRMCLYRTFMSIENENLHEVDDKEKNRIVKGFTDNQAVKSAVRRIGFSEGYRLFGKKYLALRFKLTPLLLSACRG